MVLTLIIEIASPVFFSAVPQPRRHTVEGRKLEHDRPPTTNQRKKEKQHKPSYMHVPFFGVYCKLSFMEHYCSGVRQC